MSGRRRWYERDAWLGVGGAVLATFLGLWVTSPPADGGTGIVRQLVFLAVFVVPAVLGGGLLAGVAGRGVLADVVRWFVVVVVGFWVLGIGAALAFSTTDPRCGQAGRASCRTSVPARLVVAVPTAAAWVAGRELAHRIGGRRQGA